MRALSRTVALLMVALAASTTQAQIITEFSAGISPGAGPSGIAAVPDGNLWFTESDGNRIGRITPAGVVTEFSAGISAGAFPWGITAGPDGNLWFTEPRGNRIGRITISGTAPISTPVPTLSDGLTFVMSGLLLLAGLALLRRRVH